MTAITIEPPFPVFTGADGNPLEDGYVYIGIENLNPETNTLQVYWDAALSIPAAQPLRTIGGYVSRNGSPGQLYADAVNYSILVKNKKGALVWSSLFGTGISPNSNGITFIQAGSGAVATTMQEKGRESVSVNDFGLRTTNTAAQNKTAFQTAIASLTRPGYLKVPQGFYSLTPDIELGSNVLGIEGDGKYATVLSVTGGTKVFYSTATPNEYFSLSKIGVIGDNTTGHAFYAENINHSVIDDCLFTGFSTSAVYMGGYSNDIFGCDIFSNSGSGVYLTGVLNNVNVVRNRIYANTGVGVFVASTDATAGLQVNIEQNAIEGNAIAGIVSINTKALNIKGNYFERNATTGYAYASPEALTIYADIHLLSDNVFALTTNSTYANQGPVISGNHTTPNGSAGAGTAQPLFTHVFTTYAQNAVIENNQVYSTSSSLFAGILSVYQSRVYSSIVGPLTLTGNSSNKVTFVGTYTAASESNATSHNIRDKSAMLTNYADPNFLSWGLITGSTGTWERSGGTHLGLPTWAMTDGDSAMGFGIDLAVYQELQSKWVYFGIWHNTQGSSTNARLFVGSSSSSGATDYDPSGEWAFTSVLHQMPSSGTVYVKVQKVGTGSDLLLANPVLSMVGVCFLDLPVPRGIDWKRNGVVGTGIWTAGDRIANSAPTVGQPKAWSCTVSGTPGTWVSEGNL